MSTPEKSAAIEPYCLLRAALALFQKTPGELDSAQLEKASVLARNEYEIESRVLRSPEAAGTIITEQALGKAIQDIRSRFDDEQSFIDELARNHLDQQSLQSALLRQCKVENVLESIASRASTVSEVEVGIYYHMHPEKFTPPEQREVRHILITINDDYAENTRENALQKINSIAEKLKSKPNSFGKLAMKYSECPTALQDGKLGTFAKGHLYPEIETALFKLKEGKISDVIETEVGFHIIRCDKIHRSKKMSLKKAQAKIYQLMQERTRRNCQRAWLASLPDSTAANHTNN